MNLFSIWMQRRISKRDSHVFVYLSGKPESGMSGNALRLAYELDKFGEKL